MERDRFERVMDEKKLVLEQCQAQKNELSCYNCEMIFECDTRKNYVKAVYESMSKGKTDGDFEF